MRREAYRHRRFLQTSLGITDEFLSSLYVLKPSVLGGHKLFGQGFCEELYKLLFIPDGVAELVPCSSMNVRDSL